MKLWVLFQLNAEMMLFVTFVCLLHIYGTGFEERKWLWLYLIIR